MQWGQHLFPSTKLTEGVLNEYVTNPNPTPTLTPTLTLTLNKLIKKSKKKQL